MRDSASEQQDDGQRALIAALRAPARYPHRAATVRVVETHISWVLLAGRYAYKIKKAVDLGFLDFSSLAARRHFCEEEIRLNRRLAPQIYLDVIGIGGSASEPLLGAEPAIEYAVRMRRFAAGGLMDQALLRGAVNAAHIDRLAATLAQFHAGLPPAAHDSGYGTVAAIGKPMRQNFEQLAVLLGDRAAALAPMHRLSEEEFAARTLRFEQRRQQGWVRECHGDLHLGNIVLLRGVPVPFDGIEFNPALRWIDVISEVAFLVMDLLHHGRPDFAFRLLNAYLEATGDYPGVTVLRHYLAYRAVVRAKVALIRAQQPGLAARELHAATIAGSRLLQLAEYCLRRQRPPLIIMHGLPGCGKTAVAQAGLERLQAIRLRSDVERKRLFGLAPLDASGGDIYSAEATQRTYGKLRDLASEILNAGFPVIVDAAFLRQAERERFRSLAERLALPFVILSVQAPAEAMQRRIEARLASAHDASEADLDVLARLQAAQEAFTPAEQEYVLEFANSGDLDAIAASAVWPALAARIA